jgi:hypothetical protein
MTLFSHCQIILPKRPSKILCGYKNFSLTIIDLPEQQRLLHASERIGACGRGRGSHQAKALQQENSPLGGASPYKLAPFSLAVLDINVASRILQAAIFERTIDKNSVIKDEMLIFKRLFSESIHSLKTPLVSRLACPCLFAATRTP